MRWIRMLRVLALHEGEVEAYSDYQRLADDLKNIKKRFWIDITEPQPQGIEFLEKKLNLHPLLMEDIRHERQRAKAEPYDHHLYVVFMAREKNQTGEGTQMSLVLSPNFLLTVHSKPIPFLEDVWKKAQTSGQLLTRGPDFVLYSLLDTFVDQLAPEMAKTDSELEELTQKNYGQTSSASLIPLFTLKQRLVNLRKYASQLRDVLGTLARHHTPLISKQNAIYFRDVYDHMIRTVETLDKALDSVGVLESYLTSVSNNLNVIMKKLTAITVIFLAPTLVAGIYGMNFPGMENFPVKGGGPIFAFGIMAVVAIGLAGYFRWKEYL